MGGAIYKDSAATEYTERNIFLNSQETYGRFVESYYPNTFVYFLVDIQYNCIFTIVLRLKPLRPITIHQKALFCLWIIIICLYTVVKIVQFWKWKRKDTSSAKDDILESQKQTENADKQSFESTNGGTRKLNLFWLRVPLPNHMASVCK